MSGVVNTPEGGDAVSVSVLVADDNPEILALFGGVLAARGLALRQVSSGEAALAALQAESFDWVFTDLQMGSVGGLEVLAGARALDTPPLVVIMTGFASLETAIAAIQGGAHDYITKPFTLRELDVLVSNLLELTHLKRDNAALVAELADAYRALARLGQVPPSRPAAAPVTPPVPAPQAPPPTADFGNVPVQRDLPSQQAISAYKTAAWQPEQAAARLAALHRQGALSDLEYARLKELMPHHLPIV